MNNADMDKEEIESVADRAAEDGAHSVVASCQVLLRPSSSKAEQRDALKAVRVYVREISGH